MLRGCFGMKSERRIIKSSIMTGLTEILIGILFALTGLHDWYFEHFKFFGVIGLGMLLYGLYHYYYWRNETYGY